MSSLLPTLISWLQDYGYPVLWLSVFAAAAPAVAPNARNNSTPMRTIFARALNGVQLLL